MTGKSSVTNMMLNPSLSRTPQLAILKLLTVLLQQCNTVTTITISSTSLSTVLDICHQLLLKAAIPDHHDLSLLHHTLSCLLHTSATTRCSVTVQ